jgi:erythromycin esterase
MMPCYRLCTSVVLWLAVPAAAQTTPRRSDSSFAQWARSNAIVLGSVDRPYADTAYAFVRPLVGTARILALGETIHGGHEPLQFRNQVIKYAVTRLGFTAVALESGLTEGDLIDDYIHGIDGGTGSDSVARAGLTYGFGYLPEDRELIAWLHDHNAHATHRVSFYGVDLTGGDDYNGEFPGAPKAVWSALAFLQEVAPATSAAFRTRLAPFVGRFTPPHYRELSSLERSELRAALDTLYQTMLADSSREVRASSRRRYARALRNAWMAERLNDFMALGDTTFNAAQAALRDSLIAEDTRSALSQEGTGGRLVLFAHDGHIMNARNDFSHADVPAFRSLRGYAMAGHYLRRWLANDLVIVASTASGAVVRRYWVNGASGNPSDTTSFDAALALVGHPAFVLDVRRADGVPIVATMLGHPWLFRLQTFFEEVVPRTAFDAVVYFDQITPSKDDVRDVDPPLMLYTDKHDGLKTSSPAK